MSQKRGNLNASSTKPKMLVQLLKDYKIWQASERCKVGSKWCQRVEIMGLTVDKDLMFTRWNGQPIRPSAITRWFPRFLQAHNLPPVRFHSLRHSNAALLIAAHVPVTTVAGRLGHAQVSTTTNIYAGFIRASDAKAADALSERLIVSRGLMAGRMVKFWSSLKSNKIVRDKTRQHETPHDNS